MEMWNDGLQESVLRKTVKRMIGCLSSLADNTTLDNQLIIHLCNLSQLKQMILYFLGQTMDHPKRIPTHRKPFVPALAFHHQSKVILSADLFLSSRTEQG